MYKKKIPVQQENSYKISFLFTCISNLILAIHMQSMNGYKEPFSDNGEKFLQPMCSRCFGGDGGWTENSTWTP
jgi:hypothetical protein